MLSYSQFLTEAKKKPMVYVDMDGVLCDFFGAWYAILKEKGEIKEAREDWVKIKAYLQNINDREKLDRDIEEYGGAEKFFADLPQLPGGKKIIRFLRDHDIPFAILSSPLGSDVKGSIAGKTKWLEAHGLGNVKAIFEHDKYKYAKKGDILVDDYGVNIAKWKNAGGIGIQHEEETTDQTLDQLKKYLLEK